MNFATFFLSPVMFQGKQSFYKEASAKAPTTVNAQTNHPDLYNSAILKPKPISQAKCLQSKIMIRRFFQIRSNILKMLEFAKVFFLTISKINLAFNILTAELLLEL